MDVREPAAAEYILIDEKNNWELQEYKTLSGDISIEAVGISLRIADIYEGIKLA